MVYLFYGEDTVAGEEALAALRQKVVPAGMEDLAISRLEGEGLTLNTLVEHCAALPFLSPRRLVVVEGLAERVQQESTLREELRDSLSRMPETTVLVLWEREGLARNHPLVKLVAEVGEVHEFVPPRRRELGGWIARRVRQEGAEISPAACSLLAAMVGPDLALLRREVEKLVTHVGPGGRIEERLVAELASGERLSDIFALVDAIGQRRRGQALLELRRLFQAGQHPLYVLTMVVRQFRLLLQVKALAVGERRPEQVARSLHLHPFVAEKVVSQARLFRSEELRRIYRRLVETDREIKTGRREGEVALEVLVVEVTGTAPDGRE